MVKNILIWTIAYFLGSVPFGVLIARGQQVNLHEHGSGNIGATNVARILGKKRGAMTLLGDALKGWLSVGLASWTLNESNAIAIAGLMAFLGHLFSIFLKFKGGKGIATGLGINLFLMPVATLGATGIFTLALWISNYVSLSSILAAITLPIFGLLLKIQSSYICLSLAVAILTVYKHYNNILRIIAKTEPHFRKNRN